MYNEKEIEETKAILLFLIAHYSYCINEYKKKDVDYKFLLLENVTQGVCHCLNIGFHIYMPNDSMFGTIINSRKRSIKIGSVFYDFWYKIPMLYTSKRKNLKCLQVRLDILNQEYNKLNSK